MSFDVEKLYSLLPAFYRIRDAEVADRAGHVEGPLRALLSVIANQVAVLEEDLDQLYDDQFIETCAEWVVPYIGDLVGARGLFVFPNAAFSQRAQVANTLAYRRRKGTAAVLEQLARDVTGWPANVVEYFQLLATTQYMNHIRPRNLAAPDLRRRDKLETINTPFDSVAHTAEVRRIASRRGKHNIPNIGIFLWRIGAYSITDAPAFQVDARRYRFDALGMDSPLFNLPKTEDTITHLAAPVNVPQPITRSVLDRFLELYYGPGLQGERQSLSLNVNGVNVPVSDVCSCNLSDTVDGNGNVTGWANLPEDEIAIDPELGRIAFPEPGPETVRVSYHYGFSADIGGGEYGRAASFNSDLTTTGVPSQHPTIQAALDALSGSSGAVEIETNDHYQETPLIHAPEGGQIELRAADERRPVLVASGDVVVTGGENAEVTLNGLLMSDGSLRVPLTTADGSPNRLRRLRIRHCTLVPTPAVPGVVVELPDLILEIEASIIGAVRAVDGAQVRITGSIVDSGAEDNVAYSGLAGDDAGAPVDITNSTVIGKIRTLTLKLVSNSILLAALGTLDSWPAPVVAERLQEGCVRFSFVPLGSRVPRRHKCQPESNQTAARVRPVFTSLRYRDPGYGQLSTRCAVEIREGADDEAEMGAFHDLYQPQRVANLRVRLDEYLRFGLEAGTFYAT